MTCLSLEELALPRGDALADEVIFLGAFAADTRVLPASAFVRTMIFQTTAAVNKETEISIRCQFFVSSELLLKQILFTTAKQLVSLVVI
jgi:hypothetical protein